MALPKLSLPLFNITIPSTEEKTTFRPFTVKEEKILLIAQESKEFEQIILALKQVIGNCVTDINIDNLAMFDVEYLLLNIRSKSVSNLLEFKIKDPTTSEEIEMAIEIEDIQLTHKDGHSKHITIDENTTIIMRYPSIKEFALVGKSDGSPDTVFNAMMNCIDTLVHGDSVYKFSDYTPEEVLQFADDLEAKTVKSMKEFFSTMPCLRFEKKYKTTDGTERTFAIEGTETFFI